ncbi:MAG TPA: hypothetical protein VNV88_02375 [Candidatus Solibacter sp.]|jgi:hypothetical protein|nr:hypothetical protein [Candidatus Solibacter sp.]
MVGSFTRNSNVFLVKKRGSGLWIIDNIQLSQAPKLRPDQFARRVLVEGIGLLTQSKGLAVSLFRRMGVDQRYIAVNNVARFTFNGDLFDKFGYIPLGFGEDVH